MVGAMGLEYTRYVAPGWGEGELWMRDEVVLAHELVFKPVSDTGVAPSSDKAAPVRLAARLAAFLAGEDVRFDDVRLDLDGSTPFQQSVTQALRAVPRGEVVSYGELAALAGYPGAARAAGTFCAHNRFMLLVPCHRVVGADGIGGYGSAGVGVKRRLLALEGVEL
jgi:O-6-methylguanine DNA methyltransferase